MRVSVKIGLNNERAVFQLCPINLPIHMRSKMETGGADGAAWRSAVARLLHHRLSRHERSKISCPCSLPVMTWFSSQPSVIFLSDACLREREREKRVEDKGALVSSARDQLTDLIGSGRFEPYGLSALSRADRGWPVPSGSDRSDSLQVNDLLSVIPRNKTVSQSGRKRVRRCSEFVLVQVVFLQYLQCWIIQWPDLKATLEK
ncbi:hypothetical protein DPX16_4558 [Anabarilius grahami]|uniref:Uncharacterized protein n=1 Tax=Anabarilius grahami TaxID=495550 RepID=A0A3N0YCA0_ANAGA|nr:hypothetical protein DPX16_4558 [Anabarilius grahami]